ncbi:MAG: DUF2207 domain-containing protein [bacterium]|nr:DUF2207 domain-containing protein [bacterium]
MTGVSIKADLASDGGMSVSENRTYRFRGRYKYAYRTFPLDSRINYRDFQVSENGHPYQLSDTEEPGTYTVTSDDEEIEVRWFYRAKNETRTFSINYEVEGAVKRHADGAVLYYKFIGTGFRKSTGQVDILVNPPAAVDKWKVRQWAHGPLWGSSATSETGVVTATVQNLPKKQFFELRILYPEELFSDAIQSSSYIADIITAEESTWAEEANRKREQSRSDSKALTERKSIGVWALSGVVLFAVIWFVRIARKYGKRPDVPSYDDSSPIVPGDLPPAIVSYLINERTVQPSVIMATLMDLARRGFLEFKEEQELGKNVFGKEKWSAKHYWILKKSYYEQEGHTLQPYEEQLLSFIFDKLIDGQQPDSETVVVELEVFKKNKSKVQKFFSTWKQSVKSSGESYNFFDQESFKGRNQGLMLGGVLILVSLVLIPVFHEVVLISGISGLLLMVIASAIVHHNGEGKIQDQKWKSLRSYLKKQKFKSKEPSSVLEFLEPYFIYGVAMGMTKNQLNALGAMIPNDRNTHFMAWYFPYRGGAMAGNTFGDSFSTAVASVNSAMSSSTGAGGGASGGGGGGAGGGGGGAG